MNRYLAAALISFAAAFGIAAFHGYSWHSIPSMDRAAIVALVAASFVTSIIAMYFPGYVEYRKLSDRAEPAARPAIRNVPLLRFLQIAIAVAVVGSDIHWKWSNGPYVAPAIGIFLSLLFSGLYVAAYDRLLFRGDNRSAPHRIGTN